MARIACATFCCVSLLALAAAVVADPACDGFPVWDVLEFPDGSWILIGERCLEPGPEHDVPHSITEFDASTLEGLGAQDISELSRIDPMLDFSKVPRRPDPWP